MKPVSGREMCQILERKGWTQVRIKGSHHIYTRPGAARPISVPVHATGP
jgi:predicted RNA binding protein YcfA (HicA-like mRNA interferase family)